ncbi:MAG: hypothetical protein IIY55_08285, partial [Blautia sp.]|nr:hypothetical protein [Blautia sp.]
YAPSLGKYGYVNKNYLVYPSSSSSSVSGTKMKVSVSSGYLALRTAKAYDYNNEIGELYSGTEVVVQDTSDSTYWYVYAPSLGKYGYVNKNYLVYPSSSSSSVSGTKMKVSVSSGYLALRTAKAYDSANEIGELYSGTEVVVQDTSDGTYWYVYAPSLGKYGYVNRNYLVSVSSGVTKTVYVSTGYLALRTAKAYDFNNEIGELYNGDKVQVQDMSDATYWYVYAPSLGKYGYVNKNYLY